MKWKGCFTGPEHRTCSLTGVELGSDAKDLFLVAFKGKSDNSGDSSYTSFTNAMEDQKTSTLAQRLYSHFISKHDVPRELFSDHSLCLSQNLLVKKSILKEN